MFKRSVLVIALMAVLLLGSLIDGRFSTDGRTKRKIRAAVESGITNLMPQLAAAGTVDEEAARSREIRKHPRRKAEIVPGGLPQLAAAGTTNEQARSTDVKKRFHSRAEIVSADQPQMAAAGCPSCAEVSFTDRRKRVKPRM